MVVAWAASPRLVRGPSESKSHAKALRLRSVGITHAQRGRALPWEREGLSPAKGTVIGLAAQGVALGVASRAQKEGVQLPASHSETDKSMDLSKR